MVSVGDSGDILRRLAIHDDAFIGSALARGLHGTEASGLDARTQALARVAALVACDAAPSTYMAAIEPALTAGATPDEVVGVLIALLPVLGTDRLVAAAPNVGLALGIDVDESLERLD